MEKEVSGLVAIDGKTTRGVTSSNGSKLHIVSVYSEVNRLTLSQVPISDKSNEITAIPELLDLMFVKGCVISIDAMGCQKEIAKKIVDKKADYILQVKGNQKDMKGQIEKLFSLGLAKDSCENLDIGHGRVEKRICEVITNLELLDGKEDWEGLKSVIRIRSEVGNKKTGSLSKSTRFYISSTIKSAQEMQKYIRGHWSIENLLHWNLDVIFTEDGQLKRLGNSAENFNIINKLALALLEDEKTMKKSKNLKRLKALLSNEYREKILKI